uniref:ATP-dependent RNA helicase n=1 Tax=Theileria annulata TaxID=5874 RepID=A0A3B0NA12_THEAN
MNFNLVSSPLLFIGSNLNLHELNDFNKILNTHNKYDFNINSSSLIPSDRLLNQNETSFKTHKLRKNPQSDSNLVTYTGSALEYDDVYKDLSVESDFSTIFGCKPLINTLSRIFAKEGLSKMNEYQLSLFDELSHGRDVILHSYTSSGKTFSVLLYMALRYYYQLDPKFLSSVSFSEILNRIKDEEHSGSLHFKRRQTYLNRRVLVLCPTKELAAQSANQLVNFTDGMENAVHLIIDNHDVCPKISPESIFIVGSSNQVESYFLVSFYKFNFVQNEDQKHTRSILQTIDYVFLDEMDRLIKVANQYANERKKRLLNEKPGSAYNICQTLLSISPNKLRLVCASASITRQHIRKVNTLIRMYRNSRDNLTALIRKKISATDTGRYVSIPETINHFYSVSSQDSQESKIKILLNMLKSDTGKVIVFLSSGSLFSLKEELEKHNIKCKILHHEFGIRDNYNKEEWEIGETKSNTTVEKITKLQNSIKEGESEYILIASTDSARGIHLSMLDSVYIVGRPRNVNEYIHISGIKMSSENVQGELEDVLEQEDV